MKNASIEDAKKDVECFFKQGNEAGKPITLPEAIEFYEDRVTKCLSPEETIWIRTLVGWLKELHQRRKSQCADIAHSFSELTK